MSCIYVYWYSSLNSYHPSYQIEWFQSKDWELYISIFGIITYRAGSHKGSQSACLTDKENEILRDDSTLSGPHSYLASNVHDDLAVWFPVLFLFLNLPLNMLW